MEIPSQFQFQLPEEVVITVTDGDDFESDSVELLGAILLVAEVEVIAGGPIDISRRAADVVHLE